MKKLFTFLFLSVLFCLPSKGGHLAGGKITWECLGNGDYIFYVTLYRDCNGTTLPITATINTNAPIGNIVCQKIKEEEITVSCADPSQSISCTSAMNAPGGVYISGALSKFTYKSAPVSITSVPPPSGYTFSFSFCCLPGSNLNIAGSSPPFIYIESQLYQTDMNGGCISRSAQFLNPNPTYLRNKGSLSFLATTANPDDSLYYRLVNPLQGSSQPMSFVSGFNVNAPFPDQTENALNGPITFDNENGQLFYDIASSPTGSFTYAVEVEVWRNNQLNSIVKKHSEIYYKDNLPANSNPVVDIDTSQFKRIEKVNDYKYVYNTFPGDTVDFDILAVDADFHPNGNPQNIAFSTFSEILDTVNGPYFSNNLPQINPVAPQTGVVSAINNKMSFKWHITQAMANTAQPSYQFLFRFRDDACPYPSISDIIVTVNVKDGSPVNIPLDSAWICKGDSIIIAGSTFSNTYLWLPNAGISDNKVAQPMVSPDSSGYYYLHDGNFPNFVDSIYITVESPGNISLTNSNGIITLNSNTVLSQKIWFYNGIPFYNPGNSLVPFGPGEYYVIALGKVCLYRSDTINILPGGTLVNVYPQNGNLGSQQIALDSSLGFNFQLTQNFEGELDSLYLLGVSTGKLKMQGDSLTVKLYESLSQTEIFTYSRLLNNPLGEIVSIPVGIQLKENVPYTLALSGDTGIYIYTYENVNYPSFPYSGNLQVNGALKGESLQYPSTSSNYLPAVVLAMENSFSLKDLELNTMQLYPNPGGNRIYVSGLEENEKYAAVVLDIRGKIVKQVELNEEGMEIHSLAPGFYILQFTMGGKGIRFSFVKE